MGSTGAVSIF